MILRQLFRRDPISGHPLPAGIQLSDRYQNVIGSIAEIPGKRKPPGNVSTGGQDVEEFVRPQQAQLPKQIREPRCTEPQGKPSRDDICLAR